jgi:hypothetical protein
MHFPIRMLRIVLNGDGWMDVNSGMLQIRDASTNREAAEPSRCCPMGFWSFEKIGFAAGYHFDDVDSINSLLA